MRTINRYFIVNGTVLLTGAALYVAGLVSVVSVFTKGFSFPFFVSERFPVGKEVNLIVGLLGLVLSLVCHLSVYEKHRKALGVSGKAILFCSLIGPLGGVFLLKNKTAVLSQRGAETFFIQSTKPVSKTGRITGVLVFAGAVSFLLVLLFGMVSLEKYPRSVSASQRRDNERRAFQRLVQIHHAQTEYIKTDWDKDGVCSYALFLVSLWQTLDERVFPVEINLLPKELGYAMRRAHSLDGYFYVNVHRRCLERNPDDPDTVVNEDLDYRREFAVIAFPERYNETGRLSFYIDQSGVIRCFDRSDIEDDSLVGLFVLPPPSEFNQWRQLPDEKDLPAVQAELSAP
ncbi:MAG: DUF2950 family protein [Pontiellaceae bacterium]|nr:DUF2950 family protein [Pontiellaceae bacterium]